MKYQIQQKLTQQNNKEIAIQKNNELIQILQDKRNSFCGIGTNKIKRRLNKLAINDCIAKTYRLAMEIEDKNIQAKDNPYYSDKIYKEKQKLITNLISVCKENNIIYGKQTSDILLTSYIIYFELPNCEQISFHTDLENESTVPLYEKEWDEKVNSTLDKLESAILKTYPNIVI